jgi:rod shape-determining protein MreB
MAADNIRFTFKMDWRVTLFQAWAGDEITMQMPIAVAGVEVYEAVKTYLKREYGMTVNRWDIERLLVEVGTLLPLEDEKNAAVQGRSDGIQSQVMISSAELRKVIAQPYNEIIEQLKMRLQLGRALPDDLKAAYEQSGFVIQQGDFPRMRRMDDCFAEVFGVPVTLEKADAEKEG